MSLASFALSHASRVGPTFVNTLTKTSSFTSFTAMKNFPQPPFSQLSSSPSPAAATGKRDYHIRHFTDTESMKAIQKSGVLKPGDGNYGHGIYLTNKIPGYHSPEEIKLSVRNPKLPDEKIAHHVLIDTDTLKEKGIPFEEKPGGTVVIRTKEPLKLSQLNPTYGEMPKDKT